MSKLYFTIFLLIFGIFTVKSQKVSIQGQIVDSLDGEFLPGANVIVQKIEDNQFVKGTITSVDGKFEINEITLDEFYLNLSYIGYKNKLIKIDAKNKEFVELGAIRFSPSDVMIDEVIIVPLYQYDNDGGVTLNISQMGNVGEMTVSDALETIDGLSLDYDGEVNYKGYTNFKKLLDGERMGSQSFESGGGGTYQTKLRDIPAKYIKKIEVLPEPMGKYGYYTPIINLVPIGNLSDNYNAGTNAGIKNKYGAGFNCISSALSKNIILSPAVYFNNSTNYSETNENRSYLTNPENNNTRTSISEQNTYRESGNLRIKYKMKKGSWIAANIGANKSKRESDIERETIYSNSTNKDTETTKNEPLNYRYGVSYSKTFNLPKDNSIIFRTGLSHSNSEDNNSQKIENINFENFYKTDTKRTNSGANVDLFYNNTYTDYSFSVKSNLDYSDNYEYSKREKFDFGNNNWNEETYFSRETKLKRTNTYLKLSVNRNIKETHSFSSTIKGSWNTDKTEDLIKNESLSNKRYGVDYKFSYNLNYKRKLNINFRYNNNIKWPSSQKLLASPKYINEQTIRIGNPNLKPETTHKFKLSNSAVRFFRNRMTYSFDASYSLSHDKIMSNQTKNEDDILIHSYINSGKSQSLNANLYLSYSYYQHATLSFKGIYSYQKFSGNSEDMRENSSWNFFSRLKIKFPLRIRLEASFLYDAPKISYRSKISEHYDANIDLSKPFFDNKLILSFQVKNIFAYKGRISTYYGENFINKSIRYPESPIIMLKAKFILFSFYSKTRID